jgi:DNA-3-methyladenine glycosylase
MNEILTKEFYLRPTLQIAKDLLGKVIVYNGLKARIIETEAYVGKIDKACHCYGGKVTKRTQVMFKSGGRSYIYLIYGMYSCLNVVTEGEGEGAAVLIRSMEPTEESKEEFYVNRYGISVKEATPYQQKNLMNGPGKICMAFGLTVEQNDVELVRENGFYIEDEGFRVKQIIENTRINIDYAMEAKEFLWRFGASE